MAAVHTPDTNVEAPGVQKVHDLDAVSGLHGRLDILWIVYLQHLDRYTNSQKILQKHMSAGFLSLARANFRARDGVRRYGKDYFHERAIAARGVEISAAPGESIQKVEIVRRDAGRRDVNDTIREEIESDVKANEKPNQQHSPPTAPPPPKNEPVSEHATKPDAVDDSTEQAKSSTPLESDPLRWFGILVPPELRSAQASFASAIDEAIAQAVRAGKMMRETEIEIRRLRKEIRRAEKDNRG